jgi:hypothetical protein
MWLRRVRGARVNFTNRHVVMWRRHAVQLRLNSHCDEFVYRFPAYQPDALVRRINQSILPPALAVIVDTKIGLSVNNSYMF